MRVGVLRFSVDCRIYIHVMDLFVVLAAASLGTARVVLPASYSPCTPTRSLMVALLSLDLTDEHVFIASSIQRPSFNAVDSAASVVVTAVQGDDQRTKPVAVTSGTFLRPHLIPPHPTPPPDTC